ncbi:hypothetical protein PHISCL_06384 [Aspergillus sclerotialis]|uniref:Uncharacterized protein n=1 Tax=Aspergillus sclerotialis TaxID=2070753 RepID=A0A3A2ZDR4_9EURO|nr:hypothetical protein PHISCL_06384 [Aspergillus sclerotialis]
MNRFLKNKKEKVKEAKEAKEAKLAEESDNEFSLGGMKSFKKNKKPEPEPEPKPELDLSNALPSNEDFRTSLLMPKLSARFSMLKEQDDPESMLGKASDDSVLFPKRASRLNIFGHNPSLLSDIDEVSLADGSRPSFSQGRAGSYASAGDGYGTDDDRSQNGSIMNRPRPGEGNNLFGGRQKVYKIPVKSSGTSSNSEAGRSGMGGRAVYEDDVTLSPFQRLRLKEKEERASEAAAQDTQTTESEDTMSRISSTQRTTYSSTASGPGNGQVSTAATSFDESFPHPQSQASSSGVGDTQSASVKSPSMGITSERGSVRSHRLYGQGLAQSAQNQQASTLHRLESLSRQRAPTPEWPHLNRNYSRSAANLRDRLQKLAIAEPASTSRPTSPPSSATSPKGLTVENENKDSKYGSVPPLTPPVSENEDGTALAAAVHPEDRGKATAMGLFNKPNTQFDEQQFTRRQLQMHEGRNTPPLSHVSSSSSVPTNNGNMRPRGISNTSYRSRAGSAASQYPPTQRAADHSATPNVDGKGTFFADSRSSESGDETDHRRSADASSATSHSMDGVHPALRSSTTSKPSTLSRDSQNAIPEVRYSDLSDLKPIDENEAVERGSTSNADALLPEKPDSPTLGPTGLGLSGLIHTHLRRGSDRSSIYPLPSPGFPPRHTNDDTEDPTNTSASDHATSEPPTKPQSSRPQSREKQSLDESSSSTDDEIQQNKDASTGDQNREDTRGPSWQHELKSRHSRDASTETQKEREEFEIELAERRRRVQEKLKNFAETESRSGSPIPGRQTPDIGQSKPTNAFSILKSKHHMLKQNGNVFGLGNSSTPTLVDGHLREEGERFPYSFGKHSNTSSPHIGSERPSQSRRPTFGRSSREGSRESSRSRGPSPIASFRAHRDRSGSDTSGRSKSRSRYREREDLGPLAEGAVASHGMYAFPEHSEYLSQTSIPSSVPSSARQSTEADPVMYDRSVSAASGRYRSASRSGPPSHHDSPLQPIQPLQSPETIIGSPRPSPLAPYSANATPPLYELSPEQPQGPFPNHGSPSHGVPQRAPGHVGLQKRAINKYQISEPTFVSSTSNVPTVGLPPGARLSNGIGAPPVPPMNPRRRRQTTTQNIVNAMKGDRPELHHPTLTEEHRSVSDGVERVQKPKNRLRKFSSEGGHMNVKARQEIFNVPPPSVSQYHQGISMEGGMI